MASTLWPSPPLDTFGSSSSINRHITHMGAIETFTKLVVGESLDAEPSLTLYEHRDAFNVHFRV